MVTIFRTRVLIKTALIFLYEMEVKLLQKHLKKTI